MSPKLEWPCWIGIVCENLTAQRRFYRHVLGFSEGKAGEDWVHFDLGDGNLLELVQRSSDPEYDRRRYQVGYAVEDIESARKELIARGIEPVTDIRGNGHPGGRWAYFRDPEGNIFEIKERVPESKRRVGLS